MNDFWKIVKYVWSRYRTEKIYFFITFFFSLLLYSVWLTSPIFFKKVIDIATDGNLTMEIKTQKVLLVFIIIALLAIGSNLCWRFLDYFANRFIFRIKRKIYIDAFNYLNYHSYRFFSDNMTWSLIKRMNRFIWAMEWFFWALYFDVWALVFLIIWTSIVIFYQNIYLWLFFSFYIFTFTSVAFYLTRFILQDRKNFIESETRMNWYISDVVTNNFNLLLFANQKFEWDRFTSLLDDSINMQRKYYNKVSILFWIIWAIFTLSDIIIYYLVIIFWWANYITIWVFILVISYQYQLGNRIFNLPSIFRKTNEMISDIEDMMEILETKHEIQDIENASYLEIESWEIEFKNITFKYNTHWEEVMNNFSLKVKPWEKVALVWVSWSGKSTIIKLLLRFFDIDSGSIIIDWQDISQVTQQSLRNNISLVPQDSILFHRSLAENISYSKPWATQEEIEDASKKAQCHKFISSQVNWYTTLVWERWIKLSWWERQRVAIARALLKNSKILLLDEATSSLDSESEVLIQKAINNAMQGKTTIAIAHRLSTIMKMDRIVVLEKWKIVEEGTHLELLKNENGVYKKLWDIQSWGFIGE